MKKRYASWLVLLCFGFLASYGQGESVDSIAGKTEERELKELVVAGQTQRTIRNGIEAIPDRQAKKSAYDATSLLYHMQLPQLNVNSGEGITTAAGAKVSMFINEVPATDADLSALSPRDVIRVQVLDYPQNPKYAGAEHVVNFVVRKYEWGGYTKLTASGRTLNGENVRGALYEKFVYRNITFDASASGSGSWDYLGTAWQDEIFKNFNYGGKGIFLRSSHL